MPDGGFLNYIGNIVSKEKNIDQKSCGMSENHAIRWKNEANGRAVARSNLGVLVVKNHHGKLHYHVGPYIF